MTEVKVMARRSFLPRRPDVVVHILRGVVLSWCSFAHARRLEARPDQDKTLDLSGGGGKVLTRREDGEEVGTDDHAMGGAGRGFLCICHLPSSSPSGETLLGRSHGSGRAKTMHIGHDVGRDEVKEGRLGGPVPRRQKPIWGAIAAKGAPPQSFTGPR